MFKNKKEVQMVKQMYPEGTVVELDYMDDPQAPPSGTKGTIEYVDDIGQIHVRWENGSGLAINTDVDSFHKI
ncbi:MAG: DUF4314 domain-containing protein [Methanosphaera sp. rholeuAM270]|nr:MAG: DUF4314 domain-containing protein [Methanosphaera sp. rholeuAM270]